VIWTAWKFTSTRLSVPNSGYSCRPTSSATPSNGMLTRTRSSWDGDMGPQSIRMTSRQSSHTNGRQHPLHQTGIKDLDQWFSDYAACDEAYLLHYYRTGEKGEFQSFWLDNIPLVQPKPAPPFTPTRRRFRLDGVVI
jgi:hypothetical protein